MIKNIDDDKYLVVKHEDLNRYFSQFVRGIFVTIEEQQYINNIPFNTVLRGIQKNRKLSGKKDNKYLVLNLDDEFNVQYLWSKLTDVSIHTPVIKINDIAVDIVNAILKVNNTQYKKKPSPYSIPNYSFEEQ